MAEAPPTLPRLGAGRVEVSGLTWRPFGRREPVLRDLDLRHPGGQRVLLVGPSGSGKSTLLRALAGLLLRSPTGGPVGTVLRSTASAPTLGAGAVGWSCRTRRSGVVASTIGRDVAFGLENTRCAPRGHGRAGSPGPGGGPLDMLAEREPTHALSGGEQQRLALAGALALEPALLLLDEPTAMLTRSTPRRSGTASRRSWSGRRPDRPSSWSTGSARGSTSSTASSSSTGRRGRGRR